MEKLLILACVFILAAAFREQYVRRSGRKQNFDVPDHGTFTVTTDPVRYGYEVGFEAWNQRRPAGRIGIRYDRGSFSYWIGNCKRDFEPFTKNLYLIQNSSFMRKPKWTFCFWDLGPSDSRVLVQIFAGDPIQRNVVAEQEVNGQDCDYTGGAFSYYWNVDGGMDQISFGDTVSRTLKAGPSLRLPYNWFFWLGRCRVGEGRRRGRRRWGRGKGRFRVFLRRKKC